MENPIYRIKVEVVGDEKGREIDETLRGGVECDGFAIIANQGKGGTVCLHAISNIDLAAHIAGSGALMASSLIAHAIREGKKYIREDNNPLADLLKTIAER